MLTRGEPPDQLASGLVHYVTDGVESAMRQAKDAAGDKDVMVHGADLAQSLLRAGVLDEMQIHLIPVLLSADRGSSTTSAQITSNSSSSAPSRGPA